MISVTTFPTKIVSKSTQGRYTSYNYFMFIIGKEVVSAVLRFYFKICVDNIIKKDGQSTKQGFFPEVVKVFIKYMYIVIKIVPYYTYKV